MPICPRCGKSLSSEQALAYHLNRKYKCGTWKCGKCSVVFDTKFALQLHENNCMRGTAVFCSMPSYDILSKIYNAKTHIFFETDSTGVIHSISPGCESILGFSPKELIGKLQNHNIEYISDCHIIRKSKNNENIKLTRSILSDNLYVEFTY